MNLKTFSRTMALGLVTAASLAGAARVVPAAHAAATHVPSYTNPSSPDSPAQFVSPTIQAPSVFGYTVTITGHGFTHNGTVRVRLTTNGSNSSIRYVHASLTGYFQTTMVAKDVHCAGYAQASARDLASNRLSNVVSLSVGSPC